MVLMKNEFVKYLERKNSLFVFSVSQYAHTSAFQTATGFGFEKLLFTYSNDTGTFYYPQFEEKKALLYFSKMIKRKDPKLKKLLANAFLHNEKAQKLIEKHSKLSFEETTKENYSKLLKEFINIFLYTTVIPYWILTSIEKLSEKEKNTPNCKNLTEQFSIIRGKTTYPLFVSTILSKFIKKASIILGVDETQAYFCTAWELKEILEGKNKLPKEEFLKRQTFCVVKGNYTKSKLEISYEKENYNKQNELCSEQETNLTGIIAQKGIATGKVKIVNTLNDMKGFEKGEVIVSINTNPALMPALILCSAIVTDEGGTLSHAAIIARELKKPCIVGTKNATKILQNGFLVEIDANKGKITILKK
ncbi:MAG: PEP-utilizing enzyme [archaeon]|jgi:phosphoenolpyruvate synthase/pyruvate phosphate dikinase